MSRAIPPCPGSVSLSNSCELVSGVTSERSWDRGPVSPACDVMSVLWRGLPAVIMLLSEDSGTLSCHIGGIIFGGLGTLALSREQWKMVSTVKMSCFHVCEGFVKPRNSVKK